MRFDRYLYRNIICFIYGHEPKCYQPPGAFWMKPNKGWCAYCASHVSQPPRLRKA